jgi:prepilin signal peptidase PulO-like enzyme (type II secretory pathway)
MNEIIIHTQNHSINLSGIIVGLYSFFNIIIARRACIICEYHFTKRFWIIFLLIGLLLLPLTLITNSIILSTIMGITGFTYLWGIHEIIEQEERVNKGWFPKNPKRIKQ